MSHLILIIALSSIVANVAPPSARFIAPDNAPQAEVHSVRRVSIVTKDVVFDRTTGKLYASVPSRAGANGNSIVRIDPATGQIEGHVFIGSEPGKLALSDDGHTLYVGLDGAGAVRRYDIATQTAGAQFSLGGGGVSGHPFFVKDLAVAPGNPDLVTVSRKNLNSSPEFEGVAAYEGGVQRPLTTPRHTGSDFIAFSASASTLYGFGFGGAGLQKMSVGASGVTVVTSQPANNTIAGDFKIDNGLMYMPFGQAYNPESATLVGTFSIPNQGFSAVEPDSSVGRTYFLTGTSGFSDTDSRTLTLRAFDLNTFVPTGTLEIPNVMGQITSLVRWGANGLAFGTTGGRFYIIQTTLVPSSEPVPSPTATPSATPTPTPTPNPTPLPGALREVPVVAKAIVIHPVTGKMYASVPSSAGAGGNSITPFDPVSGVVDEPINIGSEPNKLAISHNGQFIYVGLDGAKTVRRFDVASNTPGISFPLGTNQQGQLGAVDIAVAPSQPHTVAIVRGNHVNDASGGVAIYDDGVQRANATGSGHTINVIEYSASPLILYGHNNFSSEAGFRKMATASCGISVLSAKGGLLGGAPDFKIENGLAYATGGRVADPEAGTLVGTYQLTTSGEILLVSAVLADSQAGRVYFFMRNNDGALSPQTMLIRAYDMHTFLHVGTLAVPNIVGAPTDVVRWGTDGFGIRTRADKVYLVQTSLIAPPTPLPALPAPFPTPPTYTLRGQVGGSGNPPLPTVTLHLSGGQSGTTTTNPDGSFTFSGLPLCTDFTVTPAPLENYTFSPSSVTITPANQNNPNQGAFFNAIPKIVRFAQSNVSINENSTMSLISVTRTGDTSGSATVKYQTGDGTASERSDYTAAIGTLNFGPNEVTKLISLFLTDDVRDEVNETFTLTLSGPTGALLGTNSSLPVTILDNDDANGVNNPADEPQFFVRQHYLDFLNRNPDAAGLAFWVNQITSCGTDAQCIELKRINVSAAFFLSIEFQETGYLAYCAYKSAFGDSTSPNVAGTVPIMRLREFLADGQRIGQGVQVGIGNWQQQLEANKNAYALEFVQRQRFLDAYPSTMSAEEFVTKLDQNAGNVLSAAEKAQLVSLHGATPAAAASRAAVLRAMADNTKLGRAELNRAFVLMQYFGYLRRNADDLPDTDFGGWSFWLSKLNEFDGNFVQAEMVKAYISSSEYRQRFGQ